jgi:hypothetical protein
VRQEGFARGVVEPDEADREHRQRQPGNAPGSALAQRNLHLPFTNGTRDLVAFDASGGVARGPWEPTHEFRNVATQLLADVLAIPYRWTDAPR